MATAQATDAWYRSKKEILAELTKQEKCLRTCLEEAQEALDEIAPGGLLFEESKSNAEAEERINLSVLIENHLELQEAVMESIEGLKGWVLRSKALG